MQNTFYSAPKLYGILILPPPTENKVEKRPMMMKK